MEDQQPTPRWASEPVHLVESAAAWEPLGTLFAAEVRCLLGSWLIGTVEHVGSTAVPGLAAKPVIDLQAVASSPDAAVTVEVAALAAGNWHVVPAALDGRSWRRLVVRADHGGRRRLAHLHLLAPGTSRWGEQIAFRDRLRNDPALAGEYAELKSRLAATLGADREAYSAAKAAFVARVLASHADTGPLRT